MTLGVRDISTKDFFVSDMDEFKSLRVVHHYGGFGGGYAAPPRRFLDGGEHLMIPRRDIYQWLMTHVGRRAGQVFKLDRVYWPEEQFPVLEPAWQATADYYPPDRPFWNIVPTIGYLYDTIIMPDDAAVLFRMLFGGELVELKG